MFTIQETVILPVVVCGFEKWSVVSTKGTIITIPFITDIESFEDKVITVRSTSGIKLQKICSLLAHPVGGVAVG